MNLLWTEIGWEDYIYWQSQDKKTLRRINGLIKEIQRTPFTGTVYRPPKVRPKKSNFWRSVFFWQNIVMNSSKKWFLNILKEALGIKN